MLDWDSLYGEAGARAMSGGKKRFYDNRVIKLNYSASDGKPRVQAIVKGDRDYNCEIVFDEQGGLYDYACNCSEDKSASGPCRHIVAAALAYENKFPSPAASGLKTAAKRSDAAIGALIERYGKMRRLTRIADGGEKARIVPVMQIGANRLVLKFSVGIKRLYTVRDISEFAANYAAGAEKRYGVGLTLIHVPEAFDEQSALLASFICGCERERQEYTGVGDAQTYRDEIKLTAGGVDEFMSLFSGKMVACDDFTVRGGVRLISQKANAPETDFKLKKAPGGYLLETEFTDFSFIYGKKYNYMVTQSHIYPVTEAYCSAVMPVLNSVKDRGRLFIAERDMSQFYNSVLVRLMAFAEVDFGDVAASVFEAAPLEIKMYVDSYPSGEITAKIHAAYDGENEVDIFSEESCLGFVRDYESEGAFIKLLQKYFPDFPELTVYSEKDIYTLLREGLREFTGAADVYLSDTMRKIKVRKPPRVNVGVRIKSDLLGINFSAEDYTQAELNEILKAYNGGKSYVRLTDGSFVDLQDPSLAAIGNVAAIADKTDDGYTLPLYYAPYVDGELNGGYFSLERSDAFKQLVKELESAEKSLAEVPPSLKLTMRNYQKAGFRWLKTLSKLGFCGILADDMGLGKSLQIISLLLTEKKGTSIIVCPTTLVLNWVNEFNKFAPELKVLAVTGTGEERRELTSSFENYDAVITSYELLRRDADLYADFTFNYAVIDEAQYIKNPETKNSRSVKKLKSRRRFALTGTPVENSLAELWSIFDFLMPGYLFDYPRFRDTLESEIVRGNELAGEKLSRLIKPFVLRRLKTNVLKELPPKTETEVPCPLSDEQKKLYLSNLALVKESILQAGDKVNKVVVLSMLTKLRQICCEPSLVFPEYNGNSAKLSACIDLVRSAVDSGHKVLLFSQFTSMLEILRLKLSEEGITHYILKGDTPKIERVKLASRFNSDKTDVFLISLKAGGTGINLTGADVVIHYDPWWNESVMNQATDRAYRIGQDKPVQVYKLIMQDSIEEKILNLQERKSALSDIVTGAATVGALSAEDILGLLENK